MRGRRSERLVAVALGATLALGVGYRLAVGFASTFSYDTRFLATFLASTGGDVGDAPSSSARVTSAELPATQESPVVEGKAPAPLESRAPEEPNASTAPASAPADVTRADAATPAPAEPAPAPPEAEETDAAPGTRVEADMADASSRVTSAMPVEPEPGVMTDPPAGQVPDWEPIPDRSQAPTVVVPTLIFQAPESVPRRH